MGNNLAYLNGEYVPISEAKISVLDRGFLFGDGAYEVIPAYRGSLFEFSAHLARLENSLSALRISSPHDFESWQAILSPLLNTEIDQYIYLQITRGVAPKRNHLFPPQTKPTVFAMSSPIPLYPERTKGIKAVSREDIRWQNCHIKAITLLANVLLKQDAVEHEAGEAILLNNGLVTEGTSSNVFIVQNSKILTPPLSQRLLAGITRNVILKIARDNNLSCFEQDISLPDLIHANEIWIASSVREIVPIVELDGKVVGNGEPGPIWHRINNLFQAYKKTH